jgi:hypothetical protein
VDPNWQFADPPNVATFTQRSIMERRHPILLVVHDRDDGGWQFLDGSKVQMSEAMLVGLKEIVNLDDSVIKLTDLPLGWYARRERARDPWIRSEKIGDPDHDNA